MKLGKRTAKLVREALVLGHVQGAMWARDADDGRAWCEARFGQRTTLYPKDSYVVDYCMLHVKMLHEYYPTLSKVDRDQEI